MTDTRSAHRSWEEEAPNYIGCFGPEFCSYTLSNIQAEEFSEKRKKKKRHSELIEKQNTQTGHARKQFATPQNMPSTSGVARRYSCGQVAGGSGSGHTAEKRGKSN